MIRKAADCRKVFNEKMRGGDGIVEITHFVTAEEMNNKGRMFANMTLRPGCGIGFHVHENESELYYIVKGNVLYSDNGATCSLSAGDIAICPAGTGHSVTNNGEETAEICAVIVYA